VELMTQFDTKENATVRYDTVTVSVEVENRLNAEFSARSGIFRCLVISRVELIRKDKEKFRSARKIPPCGRRPLNHRIKISNRRATQRCNVSSFFMQKICSLLARRRSRQPIQRVYWPENVIDWLGKWRLTCVMRHARGPFYMDLYSMAMLLMLYCLFIKFVLKSPLVTVLYMPSSR
jgi:hypothetical protein